MSEWVEGGQGRREREKPPGRCLAAHACTRAPEWLLAAPSQPLKALRLAAQQRKAASGWLVGLRPPLLTAAAAAFGGVASAAAVWCRLL